MACQESAGGILACLSEHAELGVSGSHSFTLPFLSTQVKTKAERRKKLNWGGSRTRDECVELLKRDRLCMCVLLREE